MKYVHLKRISTLLLSLLIVYGSKIAKYALKHGSFLHENDDEMAIFDGIRADLSMIHENTAKCNVFGTEIIDNHQKQNDLQCFFGHRGWSFAL